MTGTLYIYRGIPASGKSTAARKFVVDNPGTVRINRDDIRFSMFGKYWGVDEHAVTRMQEVLTNEAMRKSLNIVSDNTNLRAAYVKPQLELARKWGYAVEFVDFPISLEEAIQRDQGRLVRVGEDVIRSFYERFTPKGKFPKHPEAPEPLTFKRYSPDPSLPRAIIVDIDGTLAHMNGRGPFDDELVHTDVVDETVRDIVWDWQDKGGMVIVMSGRDEGRSREVTKEWLKENGIAYEHLYMRAAGDRRNDAIVKAELFEEYVEPNYNVVFTLDDRNRVVDMWRAKGIKCLQVEPGDF